MELSFNEKFCGRTKANALAIIKLCAEISFQNMPAHILAKQLIRSGTSVAANFRSVARARSDKERFAKLSIVVEEADETIFWFEMFEESGLITDSALLASAKNEALEILKVMASYRKKLSDKMNESKN